MTLDLLYRPPIDARTIRLLPGGTLFAPYKVYEVWYEATGSKVTGIGFAATRDLISFLRYEGADRDGMPNPLIKRKLSDEQSSNRLDTILADRNSDCHQPHDFALPLPMPLVGPRAMFAVGTLIAERPPHRSERAQFGHSAPTSGT